MNQSSRSAKAIRRARNRPRQVAAVLAIGACLGVGAFATDSYIVAKRHAAALKAIAIAADDEVYTGSILYMPDRGGLCRQLLFDNQNGLFSDNGYVDCERAAYRSVSEGAKHWPTARVLVISDGFRSH